MSGLRRREELMREMFRAAVAAVHPEACLPRYLLATDNFSGRTIVLAAGKAAAAMAVEAEKILGSVEGLAVTRHHHLPQEMPKHIRVIEAGHPVPDDASEKVAAEMLTLAESAGEGDRVIVLMSGGASALLSAPVAEIDFETKKAVNKFLLHSGAAISEMNCVRKHLSRIKGGRLAKAAYPASVETYAISDVPGDVLSNIGSGPTCGDTSTLKEARNILNKYGWNGDTGVLAAIENEGNETPVPEIFMDNKELIIAKAADALTAAKQLAVKDGRQILMLGDDIEGIAGDVAQEHAKLVRECRAKGGRWAIISGGETTVEVGNPSGKGGRNLEYCAALVEALAGMKGVSGLACDTDGIDGTEDVAGAVFDENTLSAFEGAGVSVAEARATNCTYQLFEAIDALIKTGPTLTNVNDFRVILIDDV
ncbi:DUF4147 domain-containing protein [Kordiimonas sp. SCSIO 12603]|uniref:glycerate kinase type-2 family protein n=1 Tax=Kordiimonas sp. SCSIO 12603 TaxID=2829596 RepID=UPI0021041D1B|nr:DUF4147 domain-containing protein [Kordiimonas sp. SCSIO 12603]UTW60195.1 DUF4147 domain-containing protein [Kordiimonas sp. SCSIO 12603]